MFYKFIFFVFSTLNAKIYVPPIPPHMLISDKYITYIKTQALN